MGTRVRHDVDPVRRGEEAERRARAVALLFAEEAAELSRVRSFRERHRAVLPVLPAPRGNDLALLETLWEWVATAHQGSRESQTVDEFRHLLLMARWATPLTPRRVEPIQRTLLGQLYEAAEELIQAYPWNSKDAVLFICWDRVPAVLAVQANVHMSDSTHAAAGRVHLSIDPTTDPVVVNLVYNDLRRVFVGDKRYRPLGDRAVALAAFDVGDRALHPASRWADRMSRWNQHVADLGHAQWQQLGGYENHQRDVTKARQHLLQTRALQDTNTYSGQEPGNG